MKPPHTGAPAEPYTAASVAEPVPDDDSRSYSAQPAHIDIVIQKFVPIIDTREEPGDKRLTDAIWTLRQPPPRGITQQGPNKTLVVKAPMKIDFDLPAGSEYRLAGIAFRRVRGSGGANGHNNLPKDFITVEERDDGSSTVHVKNTWSDKGPENTWNWDFFIFVQDESGNIGIIDPDIENRDSSG